MSSVSRPRPDGQLAARKPVRPAHGTCRLTITINGTAYNVRPIASDTFAAFQAFRLRKADGTAYDVADTLYGHTCDCPDFVFHREGIDPSGCKHIKALVACGILSPTGAMPTDPAEWPAWTDEEQWTTDPEADGSSGLDPFDPDYLASIAHEDEWA